MPAIGITGGIATGKSAFCDCLRRLIPSATFYNADPAAHDLTDRDPEVQALIAEAFGPEIYSTDGCLNRELSHHSIRQPGEETRARADSASAYPASVGTRSRTPARFHGFFLRTFLFFMKPVVKPSVIAWSWSPVGRSSSGTADETLFPGTSRGGANDRRPDAANRKDRAGRSRDLEQ